MYNLKKTALEYDKRAKAAGTSMHNICRQVEFSYDTYLKWKSGEVKDALIQNIVKIDECLKKFEALA